MNRNRLHQLSLEHIVPLLLYFILSVALTWPLAANFTSKPIGYGDMLTHLWTLWHTKQALLLQAPLYDAPLVFYPEGVSLFVHGLGPVMGIFSLPFWLLGPAAAYNGATLVGFLLTGYFMYLLARSLNFERDVSFFAGTVLLVSPKHLIPLFGYTDAIFLGFMPLTLLTLNHALNLERRRWWTIAAACAILFTLLNSGWQFIIVAIATALFTLGTLYAAHPEQRWRLLGRSIVIAVIALSLTAPLLYGHLSAATNPELRTNNNLESYANQPDLIQFFIPATFTSRFIGPFFDDFLKQYVTWGAEINETTVYMSWTVLLLTFTGLFSGHKRARNWSLFVLFFFLLSLGARLRFMGQTEFTEYKLPIILPYAFLTSLPGLGFLRTPGRFMQMGAVGLGITASFGLMWLRHKSSKQVSHLVTLIAIALLLLENWPLPWALSTLPPVPEFYQQIAQDEEVYGVFDLPIRPYEKPEFTSSYYYFASYYQLEQMTHKKGITSGYISRQFTIHPVFGHFISNSIFEIPVQKHVLVDGSPANRYENLEYQLSENGYRYVVFHKPEIGVPEYQPGSWGELKSKEFIVEAFGLQPPIVDDHLSTVYEVKPITDTAELRHTIALRGSDHWARSPATFYTASPRSEIVALEITLDGIFDPETEKALDNAIITVQSAKSFAESSQIAPGQPIRLPVVLETGSQTITMTLQRSEEEVLSSDSPPLEIYFSTVDLRTKEQLLSSANLFVDGELQQTLNQEVSAFYSDGWYNSEAPTWRWAMSPAELIVYSPIEREITMEITPVFLNDPNNPGQSSTQGKMLVATNNGEAQALTVQLEQPVTVQLDLRAGWNKVTLELESGNFRPHEINPDNGDQRPLSFAVSKINFLTK